MGLCLVHQWQEHVKQASRLGVKFVVVVPNDLNFGIVERSNVQPFGGDPKDLWKQIGLGSSQKAEISYLIEANIAFDFVTIAHLRGRLGLGERRTNRSSFMRLLPLWARPYEDGTIAATSEAKPEAALEATPEATSEVPMEAKPVANGTYQEKASAFFSAFAILSKHEPAVASNSSAHVGT